MFLLSEIRTMDFETEKSKMVKLISAEGHVFVVDRRCAMVSGTVKNILQGQFAGVLC